MELKLDWKDLKPECKDTPCSATKFKHFNARVQSVIALVGEALYETNGGTNYNKIYPPRGGQE